MHTLWYAAGDVVEGSAWQLMKTRTGVLCDQGKVCLDTRGGLQAQSVSRCVPVSLGLTESGILMVK